MRDSGADRWRRKYVETDGCWPWTGSLDRQGYGQYDTWEEGRHVNHRAHRYVYGQLVRPLSSDEKLDHQCHNRDKSCRGGPTCWHRRCVRPDHLEPTEHAVNVRRGRAGIKNASKTRCPRKHPYDEVNSRGTRECSICRRELARDRQRRLRGTAADAVHNKDKTRCKYGHEFTEANTIRTKTGRNCRECQRVKVREYMRKRRKQT
jgi:hypothetical protein